MFKRSDAQLTTHYWLCSVLSPLSESDKVAHAITSDVLDWDLVMAQAHHGMVLPALYSTLSTKNLMHLVPEEIAQALQGLFELNVELNELRRDQIYAISSCLNEKDIDHIWLKGATHLMRDDWEHSPRTMLDIDIWIPNQAQHKLAFKQLSELGYESLDKNTGQVIGRGHHYPALHKPGESARLEFHQHLVTRKLFELLPDETALPNVQWLTWRGQKVGVLSPADQALQAYMQCAHMSANQFFTGQVTLMKTHDLVERLLQAGPGVLESDQFNRLKNNPWKWRANMFFTYLEHAFGFQSQFERHSGYEDRLRYPALASIAKIQGFALRTIDCVQEGRIGPFKELPQRIWRNVSETFSAKKM